MSKTIYVLTSGDYDEYRVETATADKERAEKLAQAYGWNIAERNDACITENPCRFHAFRYCDLTPSSRELYTEGDGESNDEQTASQARKISNTLERYSLEKAEDHARRVSPEIWRGLKVFGYTEEKAKAKLDREWIRWNRELGVADNHGVRPDGQ